MTSQPPRWTDAAPEVVVIGGGIVGVSCAAQLAEAGRRVVLFERTEIAAAASGRNSGVVQHPFDPVLIDLHLETLDLYRQLSATDGAGEGFELSAEPAGLLMVTHDADAARRLAHDLASSHPRLSPVFLAPDAARRLEPALAPGVAACRVAIGYPVAPAAATRAWAARATRLGVDIRVGAGARPWIDAGRAAGVELASGERVPAGDVVVAAGPWTPEVVDPSGRWRPIAPSWGVVVSMTLTQPPRHVLEEAEIDIEPAGEAVEALDRGHADDVAFSLVTAAGSSSLGSTFLDAEPDARSLIPGIVARGVSFVPAIAAAAVGAHRVCARPQSLDGRPLVGRVPGVEGLWVAAGHGPWGISTGPASGRLLADLVDGRLGSPPAALDPARFQAPRFG
ncbi:MAG TPA: FAD-binding oxidoreductase [Methylomirabilota bacterium]|nr:FAD-binding oxidoreductase [Methylomirabilota bacterium]